MKIPRGKTTEELPMKTAADFTNASKKAGTKTQVFAVENANDYTSLIRLLGSSVRPFAVALLTVQ